MIPMDRKKPVDTHIGQRLKKYRQHRGMTVRELADAAHVTPGQISRYEHGRDRISHERVTEFARILCIKPNDLYQPPGSRLRRNHVRWRLAEAATRAERVQKAIRAARATLAHCHADEFEFGATWAEEGAAVLEAVRGLRELGEALELRMDELRRSRDDQAVFRSKLLAGEKPKHQQDR
jgi:transcriptional regulator with XRE-family HTH domain